RTRQPPPNLPPFPYTTLFRSAATVTVLLTVWLAGRLFGRATGVLAGLILATMYNFTRYATLAEADMFLAPIVAGVLCVFARLERSEEHTSELQSLAYLVCRLL